MIVMFLPWLLYDRSHPDFKVIEQLIMWSMTNSVVKVVKWFGDDWKLIFGLMFSGELMTSLGDSWYLEIIFDCFDMYLYETLSPSEKLVFARALRRFKDYGDDGLMSYRERFVKSVCPDGPLPSVLAFYLQSRWHMELKLSDTFVNCDSDPRPDMTISSFFSQLNPSPFGPVFHYRGPKYLKRYIIKFVEYVDGVRLEYDAPYRPIGDYWTRLITVAGNAQSIVLHLIRLRALAVDTYGTNERAYNVLRASHDYLLEAVDPASHLSALADTLYRWHIGEESPTGDDIALMDRVGKGETLLVMMQGFPSIEYIRSLIRPDPEYDARLASDRVHRRYASPEDLCNM